MEEMICLYHLKTLKLKPIKELLNCYRQANMTFRTTIIILSIAAFIYSCNNTKRSDKEFEEQANKNIHLLDTTTLKFLKSWDYNQRGKITFWSKLSGDSSIYNCSFDPSVDTPKITINGVDNFFKDFKSDFKVDTAYYQIQFTKIGDTTLSLIGTNNHGQDILLANNLSFFKNISRAKPI